jgi:glucosamine-phosphate N-acetyltransferase
MEYTIRKLTIDDYDSFLIMINEFRQTSFTKEEFVDILNKIKLNSDIWVIEYNNTIIGTATIIYEYKFIFNICKLAHIEDVCIKNEFRKKGLGKMIVQYLVDQAIKNDCYKISLDCSNDNVMFYEACGFEKRANQMTILLKNI